MDSILLGAIVVIDGKVPDGVNNRPFDLNTVDLA
jgi:hypothetical protein